jgi:site-specific DNA-methyltransferase (adenine-specific)
VEVKLKPTTPARKNTDKRRDVEALLHDPAWRTVSNGRIAAACGVSPPFVGKLRRALGFDDVLRTGRDGRTRWTPDPSNRKRFLVEQDAPEAPPVGHTALPVVRAATVPDGIIVGDNLAELRRLPDGSVQLIYMDPPYFSGRDYYADGADGQPYLAYTDRWRWDAASQAAYDALRSQAPKAVAAFLQGLHDAHGGTPLLAYLVHIAERLIECRRLLDSTGCLWLQCDTSADGYLRVLLDAVFGPKRFRGRVVWKRTAAHNKARRPGPITDTIFFYSKGDGYTWNPTFHEYPEGRERQHHGVEHGRPWRAENLLAPGISGGESGQPWRGIDPGTVGQGRMWAIAGSVADEYEARTGTNLSGTVTEKLDKLDAAGLIVWNGNKLRGYKLFLDRGKGIPLQDLWEDIDEVWTDIPLARGRKGQAFGGQKPVALMERIIGCSTMPDDHVLDIYGGSGTTAVAAENLGRRWTLIEKNPETVKLIEQRVVHERAAALRQAG